MHRSHAAQPHRWCLAALAALALVMACPEAQADEQPLSYQLLAQDRPVGSREVKVKYLTTSTGELRLLEAWTTFVLPIAKSALKYEQRLGARFGGDRGFVASMATNGLVREVQVRQEIDGSWSVSVASAEGAHSQQLPADAVDLVSSELFDQERALRTLQAAQTLKLLSAETGAIMEGTVVDLGPATMAVGPDQVEVQRFRFEPPDGTMTLAFSDEGWLVAYDYQVLGMLVGARLQRLPPARSFDTYIDAPLTTGTVREESL